MCAGGGVVRGCVGAWAGEGSLELPWWLLEGEGAPGCRPEPPGE